MAPGSFGRTIFWLDAFEVDKYLGEGVVTRGAVRRAVELVMRDFREECGVHAVIIGKGSALTEVRQRGWRPIPAKLMRALAKSSCEKRLAERT